MPTVSAAFRSTLTVARPPGHRRLGRTGRLAAPFLLLGALVSGGCLDSGTAEVGHPFQFDLQVVEAELPLGEPHEFRLEARGRRLAGLVIDYGNGITDSIPTFGAQSASHVQGYVYPDPGTYRVRARAEEASGAVARDSVEVVVRAPGT
jgi:hypothetical protein